MSSFKRLLLSGLGLALALGIGFGACQASGSVAPVRLGATDPIVGRWEYAEAPGVYLDFAPDGRLTLISGSLTVVGAYKLSAARQRLDVDFPGESGDLSAGYRVSATTLTITDAAGKSLEYHRVP